MSLILQEVAFELVPSVARLFVCRTPAGFPSPAQDDMEEPIDLASWLIDHPAASYVMRVAAIRWSARASQMAIWSWSAGRLKLDPVTSWLRSFTATGR